MIRIALLCLALGAGLGWMVEHYRLSAALAEQDSGHSKVMRDAAERYAKETDRLQRDADALQQQMAGLDDYYTKELTHARNQTRELRDAVDAGDKRLRVLVKCPASCPKPASTADRTGVDTGTAVELAGSARTAYFRLRDGITADTQKLLACQSMLKRITAARPP